MDIKRNIKEVDYNIEYSHIYTDEDFGFEQRKSIKILKNVTERLKRAKKSYVLTVLIDEYNPAESTLSIKNFLGYLGRFKARPDFVCFESQLVSSYKLLLEKMVPSLRKEYVKYIEKHKKIPCSLLIAVWHLKRLGLIRTHKEELNYLNEKPVKNFIAKKIITILPQKYREVELRGLEIIASTHFKKYLHNISNIYF